MSRLRLILPTGPLVSFLVIFAVAEVPRLLGADEQRSRMPRMVLCGGAVAYGLYRVFGFHPFYRPGYRAWLERTPWTSAKPLPLGPVGPCWSDPLVIAGLCGLSLIEPTIEPAHVVRAMLLANALALAPALRLTGVRGYGSAVLLLAGLSIRLTPEPWQALGAALAASAVAHVGLRRSLDRFPWEGLSALPRVSLQSNVLPQPDLTGRSIECGWPHDWLSPLRPPPIHLQPSDAVSLALVGGWWLFAVQGLFSDPADGVQFAAGFLLVAAPILAVLRFWIYRWGQSPPLGLFGRLATRRLVIPAFDQIYLGPILTLVAPLLTVVFLRRPGGIAGASEALAFGVALLVVLLTPPGLTKWRLTGGHRIVFPFASQSDANVFTRVG